MFHDFIYVSLFQRKGQNSLSESDELLFLQINKLQLLCKIFDKNQSPNMTTRVFKLSNDI